MLDELGDRMKEYEAVETRRRLDITHPIYARIDGRGFSKFTKGMNRPYDHRMSSCMIETVSTLVEHTHAKIGFTQSDEISLCWQADSSESSIFFDGKTQKMASVLSSLATAAFTRALLNSDDADFRSYISRMPHFDCRVFQIPSRVETANAFVWRAKDARRNAVLMVAQHHLGHKRVQNKNVTELLGILLDEGIDFETFPDFFKNGTFVRRETELRMLREEERLCIPEAKRPDPAHLFSRSSVKKMDMPFFLSVQNREEVIFDGKSPVIK